MRKFLVFLPLVLGGFTASALFWWGMFALVDQFGFNSQLTKNYAFSSGVGPMILTGIGMSTIIVGLWHSLNCHQEGCFNVGRHRVNGTPWCNIHHGKARAEVTDSDRLDQIVALLESLNRDR